MNVRRCAIGLKRDTVVDDTKLQAIELFQLRVAAHGLVDEDDGINESEAQRIKPFVESHPGETAHVRIPMQGRNHGYLS